MREPVETVDVVVLGAGMAGLAAAAELAREGLEVRVIEARDRVGGRVCTLHAAALGLPVELGAEFVHGDAPAIERLARDAGAALLELEHSHWRGTKNGLAEDPRFEARIGRALESAEHAAERTDMPFADAVKLAGIRNGTRRNALDYVQGFQAADTQRISTRALAAGDLGSERMRRALFGYDKLALWLEAHLPPRTVYKSTIARRVHWRRGHVTVETGTVAEHPGTRFHARAVVISVPVSVLASGAIEFDPPLVAKEPAFELLPMGDVIKVMLRFEEAFWTNEHVVHAARGSELHRLGFVHAPGEAFPTWWTTFPIASPLMTGWCGGPTAHDLSALEDGAVLRNATASLARALDLDPGFVEREIEEWWRHDWANDPYARGAYSYVATGGQNAPRVLRKPLAEALFFAGEATCDPPDNGTVHGAIESGQRAAREVLAHARAKAA